MFNALRRGPASLGRVVRIATTSATPAFRSSRLITSFQNVSRPAISARAIHISYPLRYQFAVAEVEDVDILDPRETKVIPTITKFQELADEGLVHPKIIEAITKGMGHETMTDVQQMTINQTLKRTDIIAQAKTGTGKTLGFLIPAIQNILDNTPELANPPMGYGRQDRAMPSDIRTIIISPTRELAEQIAVEAQKITKGTGIVTQVAVGGNSKRAMLMQMQRQGCHLLVATPGRLYDLLSDPYSRVAAPKLNTLILDEADRLLDAGFSQAIGDITKILPDRSQVDRQTLLFSATVPKEVMGLVRNTLKPDYEMVRTVKAGEQATHEKVPQKIVECAGLENIFPAVLELCKREVDLSAADVTRPPFKAIVYLNSTAMVELAAETFDNLKPQGSGQHGKSILFPCVVSDMHAKLTQSRRQMVSDRFRKAKTAIMFSTDVTARGMDFPGVTHVIQVGLAPNKEQYIHRVGRTGRGDKSGEGWLFVAPAEVQDCRSRLRGLPIVPDQSLLSSSVDMTRDAQLPTNIAEILSQVGEATKMVGKGLKTAAYGTMGSTMSGEGREILSTMERWSRYGWGWEVPPQLPPGVERRIRSMRQGQTQTYGRRGGGGGAFGGRGGGGGFGGREGGRGGAGGYSGGRGAGGFGGRDGAGRGTRYEGSGGLGGGRDAGFGGGREGGYGGGRDGGRDGGFSGGRERSGFNGSSREGGRSGGRY